MDSLDDIAEQVRRCTDCPLHAGRANAVPGEGHPHARLLFIGEGPGREEDRQGRPFVGPAGQLLDELLASIGAHRSGVYIANMVKCRPPDNRDPAPDEIQACSKYLDRQIELLNPQLIVTLGRFSLGKFFPGEGVTRARGQLRQHGGRQIFPMLHPAAALRRSEHRGVMFQDFQTIAEILNRPPQPPAAAPPTPDDMPEAAPPPPQIGLFGEPTPTPTPPSPQPPPPEVATEPPANAAEPPPPGQLAMF